MCDNNFGAMAYVCRSPSNEGVPLFEDSVLRLDEATWIKRYTRGFLATHLVAG
jgi:hypothetical protein